MKGSIDTAWNKLYDFVDQFDGIETYTPRGYLKVPFSNQNVTPNITPLIEAEYLEITHIGLGLESSASFGLSLDN